MAVTTNQQHRPIKYLFAHRSPRSQALSIPPFPFCAPALSTLTFLLMSILYHHPRECDFRLQCHCNSGIIWLQHVFDYLFLLRNFLYILANSGPQISPIPQLPFTATPVSAHSRNLLLLLSNPFRTASSPISNSTGPGHREGIWASSARYLTRHQDGRTQRPVSAMSHSPRARSKAEPLSQAAEQLAPVPFPSLVLPAYYYLLTVSGI